MTLFDFSSKQSSEEESKSFHLTMKLSEPLLYKGILLACMALLDMFSKTKSMDS